MEQPAISAQDSPVRNPLSMSVFAMGQIAAKHVLAALGELPFTQPEGLSIIAYTNGYFRYICPEEAYAANHYEAMAAIVGRGSGERLMQEIQQLRRQLQDKH